MSRRPSAMVRLVVLMTGLASLPAAAGEARRLALTVKEPSGVARSSGWVENGVPFGKGELKDPANARLLGPGGEELPLDAVPLSLHEDGSVKWLLVSFPLDVAARGEAKCVLEYGPGVKRAELLQPLKIDDGAERLTIDAGALRVSWPKVLGVAGPGDVWVDLDGDGKTAAAEQIVHSDAGPGLEVTRAGAAGAEAAGVGRYAADLARGKGAVTLERAGRLSAVVKIDGVHVDADGGSFCPYTMRWTVRSGSRALAGTHTVVYSGVPEEDFLGSASVGLTAKLGARVRLSSSAGGETLSKGLLRGRHALVWQGSPTESAWATEDEVRHFGRPAWGWLHAEGDRGRVTVAIRNFALRYPKAIRAELAAGGAVLKLYPYPGDLNSPLDFRRYADEIHPGNWGYETSSDRLNRSGQGAAFSHDLYIGFGGPGAKAADEIGRARAFDSPLLARPTAAHVAATEALYPFGPSAEGKYPVGENYVRAILDVRIISQREFAWYGVLDYGDSPKGTFEGAWLHWGGHGWWTKTSPVPCLLTEYYRTGERRYYDHALAMARNTGDVATVHFADGKGKVWKNSPADVGSVHRHGYQHWSGYAGSPQYTGGGAEGMLDAYLMTGNGRFLDVAREMAAFNMSRRGLWGFDYMIRVYCQLSEVFRARAGAGPEAEKFEKAARDAAKKLPKNFAGRWPNMVSPGAAYASRTRGLGEAEARLKEFRKGGIDGLVPAVARYRISRSKADLDAAKKTYRDVVTKAAVAKSPPRTYADVVAALGRSYPWTVCDYLGQVQGVPAAMRLFEELGVPEKDILGDAAPIAAGAPSGDTPPPWPAGLLLADDIECHHDAILSGAHRAGSTYTAGITGHGIRIDGADRYYHYANPSFRPRGWRSGSAARFDATLGSVSFWFRPAFDGGRGGRRVLFAESGAPGGEGLSIEVSELGLLELSVRGPGGTASAASPANVFIKRGEWVHVAGTWDLAGARPELRLFVNGNAVATGAPKVRGRKLRTRAGIDLDLGSLAGRCQAPGVYDGWRIWSRPLDKFPDSGVKPNPGRGDVCAGALLNDPLESAAETKLLGGSASGKFEAGWHGKAFSARGEAEVTYPVGLGRGETIGPKTRFDPRRGSIELRVKPGPGGGKRTLVAVDNGFWFGWVNGKLVLRMNEMIGKEHIVQADCPPEAGAWQHLACSWDTSVPWLALYSGGELIAETKPGSGKPFSPKTRGALVHVGAKRGKDSALALIDGVKIWDAPKKRFLSAEGVLFYASFDGDHTNSADYAEGDAVCYGLADRSAEGIISGGVRQWGLTQIRFLPFAHCEVGGREPLVNITPDFGTAAFWMKPSEWTVNGTRRNIFMAPLNREDKVQMAVQEGTFNVRLVGMKTFDTPTHGMQAGRWYHVALAWDRRKGTAAVYLDGKELKSYSGLKYTGKLRDVVRYDGFFLLGGWYEHESPCSHASFDELVIYRQALGAAKVKALYERQKGGQAP